MYKILIKYTSSSSNKLWNFHGTTTSTSNASGSQSTFTEFETDDISVLEAEVKKLDMELGHAYIKVIKEIDYDVLVDVTEENEGVKASGEDVEEGADSGVTDSENTENEQTE